MRVLRLDQSNAALVAGGSGLELQVTGWWLHVAPASHQTSLLEYSYGRDLPSPDEWLPLAPGQTSHRSAEPWGSVRVRLATGVTGVALRAVILMVGGSPEELPPAGRYPEVDADGQSLTAAHAYLWDGAAWQRARDGAGAVAAGVARVTLASNDPAVVALQVVDDWDEADRAKVNAIVGQAGIAAGAGAVGATVPRVTLASDDPAVANLAIVAGTVITGRVRVNPVAGQIGVQAAAGAVDALTQRVTLGSDDPAVTALRAPTTPTSVVAQVADFQSVAALAGRQLFGWGVRETLGAAASFRMRVGTTDVSPLFLSVNLGPLGAAGDMWGPPGVDIAAGLFVEVLAGSIDFSAIVRTVA